MALAGRAEGAPAFDETPPAPREWGFRPAEGEVCGVTPPPFVWRPQRGALTYHLQVAATREFSPVAYEARDVTLSAHCPPQVLAAGDYYWRVRVLKEGEAASEWSQPRRFTIARDALESPLPTRAELMARVPKEHPRVYLRPEDLPRLRELAAGPLKKRYERLVKQCDALIANPPTTSDYPTYPEGTVRLSEAWSSQWRAARGHVERPLVGAFTLGLVWQLGGGEKYGQEGRRILMEVARWNPVGGTGFIYNDEAGMRYAFLFGRAYSMLNGLLTEEERQFCRQMMTVRGREMYQYLAVRLEHLWRPLNSHSNRSFHFLGEAAIAFLGEIPEAEDWLWWSANVFATVYPVWNDDDGGWHEGVGYWHGYMSFMTWWLDVQQSSLGIDGFRKPYFSRIGYFPIYAQPVGSKRHIFGDQTGIRDPINLVGLMTYFSSKARNPYWVDYVERIGGPSDQDTAVGFLRAAWNLDAPPLEKASIAELPTARLFSGTGLAFLHTDLTDYRNNVMIAFKSSPFGTQSHGNEAQNSFELHAWGEPLLVRSGTREIHGSPHHRDWMWQTHSCNAIQVNGQGQVPHNAASVGRITRFVHEAAADYVVGDATGAYPEGLVDRHERHILFIKPGLVCVFDEVETPEPARLQYWLHSPEPFALDDGQNRIGLAVGDVRGRINLLAPAGLSMSQTDRFDPMPRRPYDKSIVEHHFRAETPAPAKSQQVVALIWPHRAGETFGGEARHVRTDAGYAIEATLADGRVIILWRTGPGRLTGYGLATDADVAMVRLDARGLPVSHFVSGGEGLTLRGERLR